MGRIGRGHKGIYRTNGNNISTNTIENFNSPPSASEQVDEERFSMLDKYWEREDDIRTRVEEREDTAYQRAVEDMKKAGIDVALASTTLQPAQSGGGISNASRIEEVGNTKLSTESQEKIAELQRELEREIAQINANQQEKNRISNLIGDILRLMGLAMLAKK